MDLKQEQTDNSEKSVPWDSNLAAIIEYLLKKLVPKKPRIWDGVVIEYNWHFRFSERYVMSKFLLVMIFSNVSTASGSIRQLYCLQSD